MTPRSRMQLPAAEWPMPRSLTSSLARPVPRFINARIRIISRVPKFGGREA